MCDKSRLLRKREYKKKKKARKKGKSKKSPVNGEVSAADESAEIGAPAVTCVVRAVPEGAWWPVAGAGTPRSVWCASCSVEQVPPTDSTTPPLPNEEVGAKWLERHVTCGSEICRKTSARIASESTSKGKPGLGPFPLHNRPHQYLPFCHVDALLY